MNLHISNLKHRRRETRAFTMVEIVLSLAIIAVAMVAIIGVLPLGLNVQADNQEESIIGMDAGIWTDAIRDGVQGMEYLPNYVEEVGVEEIHYNLTTGVETFREINYYNLNNGFTTASNLVGLLSMPRLTIAGNTLIERNVSTVARAINGNMADISSSMDFAFKYRMSTELVPYSFRQKIPFTNVFTTPQELLMGSNLWELRMTFKWPVLLGTGGDYRAQTNFAKQLSFRTLISGSVTNYFPFPELTKYGLNFVVPGNYQTELTITNTP